MGEKYPPLAKMLELEEVKDQIKDAMEYNQKCKERPQKLKV